MRLNPKAPWTDVGRMLNEIWEGEGRQHEAKMYYLATAGHTELLDPIVDRLIYGERSE